MTKLAQRSSAEAAPVAIEVTGPYRLSLGADQVDEAIDAETFPAWSSLSWNERADYVARYCL